MDAWDHFTTTTSQIDASHRPQPGQTMNWVTYKEIYLDRLETRHPGSLHPDNARRVLDRFTRYCSLIGRPLAAVTALDLEQYVARRRRDHWRGDTLTPRTLNNEIQILNAALGHAAQPDQRGAGRCRLGLIERAPYVEPLPELETEPVALTADQLAAFVDATRLAKTPRVAGCDPAAFWQTALILGLVSSLRRGGLLRVPRPDDYTLRELHQIVLPAEFNKVRRVLRISLGNQQVADMVASLPTEPGEPLLPWKDRRGRPMTMAHFNATMRDFQRAAGIPESQRVITKHWRSTAATETAENFSDAIAKRKLGHSATSKTLDRHYKAQRISPEDVAASEHLAALALPLVKAQLRVFEEGQTA